MVPIGRSDEVSAGGALVVHASPLLDILVNLFERYWERSSQVAPDLSHSGPTAVCSTRVTPLNVRLLGLLDAGLTDRAVAIQLGLSMRTVQRRVRALMDRTGVDTRFRLGAEAVQRGWIR